MPFRQLFTSGWNVAFVYWLEQQEYYEEYVAAQCIFGFLSCALALQALSHWRVHRSWPDEGNALVSATRLWVSIIHEAVWPLLVGSSHIVISAPRSLLLTELLYNLTVDIWPWRILLLAQICIPADLSIGPWWLVVWIFWIVIAVILSIFLLLEA